jgi:alcohol dehydrogenase
MALTDGLGVDVAIEAVGLPETFAMVLDIVRPAGHVANAGVHGVGVELPLDRLWISNVTITTGLVNTNTTGTLLKLVAQKKLPVDQFVSHAFDLNDIEEAYDTFARAAETMALKVMLNA